MDEKERINSRLKEMSGGHHQINSSAGVGGGEGLPGRSSSVSSHYRAQVGNKLSIFVSTGSGFTVYGLPNTE